VDVLIGWPGGDWQATAGGAAWIVGGYLALIWVTTILWTYRDIRSRSRDPLSQLVGVAMSLVPFVGLPLYFVVRPRETLQHAYDRQLEQEAILSELYTASACPDCRRPVQDEFVACPYCQTSLKEACADCGRLLAHAWRHCPYCGVTRESARSAARLEFSRADAGNGELESAPPAVAQSDTGPEPASARPPRRRSASGESAAP
jgi:RNA polymerase subunit RPABC4/transcription elongation factor Spt4